MSSAEPGNHSAVFARLRDPDRAAWSAADHADLGRRLVDAHALLDAQETLRQGLDRWPDDVPLRQLMGRALSRAEVPGQAVTRLFHVDVVRRSMRIGEPNICAEVGEAGRCRRARYGLTLISADGGNRHDDRP